MVHYLLLCLPENPLSENIGNTVHEECMAMLLEVYVSLKSCLRTARVLERTHVNSCSYCIPFILSVFACSLLIGIRDFENDPREELPSMEMRERSLGASRQDSRTARRDPAQSLGYVPPSPIGGISVNSSLPPLAGGLGQPPPHMTPPIDQSDADLPMPWHRSFYGGLLGLPPVQPPSGPQAGDDNLSVTESALHEIGSGRRSGAATVATGGDGSGQGSQAASGDAVKREEKVWSVYYMGLIDILQSYNFSKKAEHFFKSNIRCMDSHGISAVNVNEYAERFIHAMDTILV